ncbi:hypothetical protein [Halosimplex amylolyticum]|uniref:hypothetical protein n=1 Tax=Halosimplex amylolyticum TaxID=3396616 RepID=UPI003F565F62
MTSETEFDQEMASDVADDSLRLFRINLILAGLYSSVLAFFYQAEGQEIVRNILSSGYTAFGFAAWFGAMIWAIFHYRYARRLSFSKHRDQELSPPENAADVAVNFVSAIAIGTLLSTTSFVIGFFDGFSEIGIPLTNLILPVSTSIAAISVIFVFLYYFDRAKMKFEWLRWGFDDFAEFLQRED